MVLDQKKTSLWLNLISLQLDIDKKYLYAKDLYEVKYQLLINKRGSAPLKHFEDPSVSIEYLNDMDEIYKKKW